MKELANEYIRSAELLEKRIRQLQESDPCELERITLLQAERKYLLKQAYYLEHYYDGN